MDRQAFARYAGFAVFVFVVGVALVYGLSRSAYISAAPPLLLRLPLVAKNHLVPSGWRLQCVDCPPVFEVQALAVSAEGRPVIAFSDSEGLYYARYDGTAWQQETLEAGFSGNAPRNIVLEMDQSRTPHLAYVRGGQVLYARRAGDTWVRTPIGPGASPVSLVLDADGRPRIAYVSSDGLAYGRWDGTTWVTDTVAGPSSSPSDLALDRAGDLHMAYLIGGAQLDYARWDGSTWFTETVAVASGEGDSACSLGVGLLALDGAGTPHISYVRWRESWPPSSEVIYARRSTAGIWDASIVGSFSLHMRVFALTSLVVDDAGMPHLTYLLDFEGIRNVVYAHRDGDWADELVVSFFPVGVYRSDPSVAVDPAGKPYVAYYDGWTSELSCVHPEGETWSASVVTVRGANNVGRGNRLALDRSGKAHIAYAGTGYASLKYAQWDGAAWSLATVFSVPRGEWVGQTSFALDAAGTAHLVSCAHSGLRYLRQSDGGWTTTLVDGRPCSDASLVVDHQGRAHIVFAQETDDLHALVHARWTGTAWVTDTVEVCDVIGSSVVAEDAEGSPHIAYSCGYYGDTHEYLRYAGWSGTSWVTDTVDVYDDYYGYALAVDGQGNAHIAYSCFSYSGPSPLRYARWSGGAWVTATVDLGNLGYPSLALDGNGSPQIAYATLDSVYSGGWDELRYARWGGQAWLTATVASDLSDVQPRLALDKTGNPHISYHSPHGGLQYARWSEGAWAVETVDGREDETTGEFSLVLDDGGVPHISLYRERVDRVGMGSLWYAVRR